MNFWVYNALDAWKKLKEVLMFIQSYHNFHDFYKRLSTIDKTDKRLIDTLP